MKPVFSEWSEYEEEEVPFRTRILRKGIGIIEMEYYNDNVTMWCPFCSKAGFQVRLGPKIIMPGQVRQPDYENWLQCPDCYEVVAAYTVEGDASIIKDDIPTVETPFDNSTEIMGAVSKRTTKAGKRALSKRRKERDRQHHKDAEIDREIQQYGSDNVHVVQDSDP